MAALKFELQQRDALSAARTGNIITDHGSIPTPVFMPVGTAGSVKSLTQSQLGTEVKAK
ncbi:MAG TPA: tRNA guanosine(34) transglycosylase Tgt, partial [Agriterribacter sp.]|nr:tRNA guanosine(34) transglycosylase Tgt [Agriterribacter sp.]